MSEPVPTHDCPIMGAGTELVHAWNPKTKEIKWVCAWCAMAEHMTGEKPKPINKDKADK